MTRLRGRRYAVRVTPACARLVAVLLLAGLVSAGAAPCLCAAAPAAAADHCGAPAPGLRDAHDTCACPCMTSGGDVADRAELEPRVVPAAVAAHAPPCVPQAVLLAPAPRAAARPERASTSPPTVLRI